MSNPYASQVNDRASTQRSTSSDNIARKAGSFEYRPSLDGVRAVAVFGVLISHFGLGPALEPLEKIVPWGHMGVHLFFVLSGFLITSILIDCRMNISGMGDTKQVLKAFYMRRVLRIFPIYYVTIFVVLLFGDDAFKDVVLYHIFYLSNTVSATYAGPAATGGLIHPASAHFWSLSVEEQFYMFWPMVILLVPLKHLFKIALLLIILAPLTRAGLFIAGYQHIVGYLPATTDALVAGAILAFWRAGYISSRITQYIRPIFIFACLGLLICLLAHSLGIFYRPRLIAFPLFEAIVYTGFIWCLISEKLPYADRALSTAPLVAIGKVSYAIYLTHTFVFDALIKPLPLPELSQFVLGTIATIIVAFASWYLLEKPMNSLKAFFPYTQPKAKSP